MAFRPTRLPSATPQRSLRGHAAAGAIWLLLDSVGVQGVSFATFAVIARYVGTEDVGLIGIAFLVTQGARTLLVDAPCVAVSCAHRPTDIDYTTGFWLSSGGAAVATAAVAALAGPLEWLFRAPGLGPVVAAMSLSLPVSGLSRMHESWLSRQFRFSSLALRSIAGSLAGAVAGIALAVRGYGAMALVCQQIVIGVTAAALLWSSCAWRPTWRFSPAAARAIGRAMRGLVGNNLLTITGQSGDTALVAFLFGPVVAGLYNVGKRVKLALLILVWGPFSGTVTPMLAEIQQDKPRLRRAIVLCTTLICTVCAPVFLGMAAVSDEAVLLVFGRKWAGAGTVLGALAFGGLAETILFFHQQIFMTQNKASWCGRLTALYIGLALTVVMLLAGIRSVSPAWAFVLPYAVTVPMSLMLTRQLSGVRLGELARFGGPGLVSAAAMYGAVVELDRHIGAIDLRARLAVLCVAGGAIYAAALSLTGRRSMRLVFDLVRSRAPHREEQG